MNLHSDVTGQSFGALWSYRGFCWMCQSSALLLCLGVAIPEGTSGDPPAIFRSKGEPAALY